MTPSEPVDQVSELKAQAEAAIAAARAAQAEAEAAIARAEAAQGAAQAAAAATPPAAAPPPAVAAAAGPLTAAQVETIRAGYAFAGPALEMGALVNGDARPDVPVRIPLAMTNRHGLVAGATGTGKTKTLQVLAEQLSAHGVSVFAADIKGDLSGVATAGTPSEKLLARTRGIGQDWSGVASPTEYFSLGGVGRGIPVRATVAGFGPLLLSKVLGLGDTQESSLGLVFHYADQAGLPLLDLTDLRAVLSFLISDAGKGELTGLGGLSPATVGVILRELITFADQGADVFFGEPEIDTAEFLRSTPDGRGIISLLEVPGVADKPALFSTFLMWLLADLFNDLPEVGDLDKPKLVFFLDEAHLLFKDASKDFLASITQTVRLIRSKGVGIFFVTQTPKDVPSDVLAQLGSRVQHQLRAFTPDDAKALRATVSTYPNSGYDLEEVLTGLGTGEAIVTVMNEKGAPSPVAWTRLRAPQGSMSPTPPEQIDATVAASPLLAVYGAAIDRDSAREMLATKLEAANRVALAQQAALDQAKAAAELEKQQEAAAAQQAKAQKKAQTEYDRLMKQTQGTTRSRTSSRPQKSVLEQVLGSSVTKSILTGVVSGIFGTRRRR
ncbi:DNA helicase HerA-like ATPase [Cryobacterium sp. MP_M5]|uniref:helicase HerA-like domain-containing protein n=1 Tax=unclassified Cryobacterium TaxID=2649013 RepID=UPI0018CA1DF3|nr:MULTISPECIES: helicase HerA-like domain-containing protein [unclassified Cryobacterium]MBG6056866.1 DNA helicase HerA-like ATPase [Cryobacterium sp. MP_M3]MEC5175066.1 DNA helicase HerA-like ATPase [Cryobacterium sp. MP_M5]